MSATTVPVDTQEIVPGLDRLLTYEQAWEILNISRATLTRIVGSGELRPVTVGKSGRARRIRASDLARYMAGLEERD